MEGLNLMVEAGGSSKLLVGSSEYVLTYEDKEGDWMLVGDVPWRYIFFYTMYRCSRPIYIFPDKRMRIGCVATVCYCFPVKQINIFYTCACSTGVC